MTAEDRGCPECGGRMLRRTNRRDGSAFLGCARFPDCKGTRDLGDEEEEDDEPVDDESPSDKLRRADKARWRD